MLCEPSRAEHVGHLTSLVIAGKSFESRWASCPGVGPGDCYTGVGTGKMSSWAESRPRNELNSEWKEDFFWTASCSEGLYIYTYICIYTHTHTYTYISYIYIYIYILLLFIIIIISIIIILYLMYIILCYIEEGAQK